MAFFKTYEPPAILRSLVREFQVYHVTWKQEKDLPAPFITCLANTEQNLYFYISDPIRIVPELGVEIPAPPVVLTGPKYKPVGLLFGDDYLMIKIAFQPTGVFRLLGIDMQQTVNKGLNAVEFWGEALMDILKRLRQDSSYDRMVERICDFISGEFQRHGRPEEPIDAVVIEMRNPLRNFTLKEWAAMACLSPRQFERNFSKRVGLPPKLFIRIVRFEHAMEIKNRCPDKSWGEIALESGYTDSSHLLREFKQFAEFPPSCFYMQPTSGHSDHPTG